MRRAPLVFRIGVRARLAPRRIVSFVSGRGAPIVGV